MNVNPLYLNDTSFKLEWTLIHLIPAKDGLSSVMDFT